MVKTETAASKSKEAEYISTKQVERTFHGATLVANSKEDKQLVERTLMTPTNWLIRNQLEDVPWIKLRASKLGMVERSNFKWAGM